MNLKVLIVEDHEDDAALILDELNSSGYVVTHRRVDSADQLRASLVREQWDVLLCDYSMPGFDATDALSILKSTSLDIPFIIISGVVTDEVAILAMQAGASDYLKKDNLSRLGPAIAREMRQVETRRSRAMVADSVSEAAATLHAVIQAVTDPAIVVTANNRLQAANEAFCETVGRPVEDVIGRRADEIVDASCLEAWSEASKLVLAGQRQKITNFLLATHSGQSVGVSGELIPTRDEQGFPAVLALLTVSDAGYPRIGAILTSSDHRPARDESGTPLGRAVGAAPSALIVAGQPATARYLSTTFGNAGYRVSEAADFEKASELARLESPDVVMIDSSFDGAANLCANIKRSNAGTAVVVLGGPGGQRKEIEAVHSGADDYVEEGVKPDEILARAGLAIRRAVSAQSGSRDGRTYTDGELQIDFVRRAVVVRGKPIQLTATEFSILEELVRHPDEPIGASDLVKRIWGPEYETEDIVRWHLSRLRHKIELDSDNPRLVTTRRGFGYQYTVPSDG